jgi:polysaccharide biosynthesis protein PslH
MGDRAMTMRYRPRVLAVTSEVPWPLNSGGHLRTYHLLRSIAEHASIRLVVPAAQPDPQGLAALQRAGVETILVPVPSRNVVRESVRAAAAVLASEPYVLFTRHRRRAVRHALLLQASEAPPDVLYLDHLDSLVYADCAPGARIVIDMHNVYSHLARRSATEYRGISRKYMLNQAQLLERQEHAAAAAAHTVMTVSPDDARYFARLGAHVTIIPNGVDCSAFESAAETQRVSRTVLYVGALDWPPNVNAAKFLARDVLPALRQRVPDARVALVGRNPSADVRALATPDGSVEVHGDVPDVVPFFADAAALAVPLEAGGGSRLKILEAFAAGLPVVSTPIGCEGIEVEDGEHLVICQRDRFADALAGLLSSPAASGACARNARTLVQRMYDWRTVGQQAAETISQAALR